MLVNHALDHFLDNLSWQDVAVLRWAFRRVEHEGKAVAHPQVGHLMPQFFHPTIPPLSKPVNMMITIDMNTVLHIFSASS
jgi:hypothetical protein